MRELHYDLRDAIMEETERILGRKVVSSGHSYNEIVKAMSENKFFKEFYRFHEQSLKNGLKKLDRDAGNFGDYFGRQLMRHLEQTNDFRRKNNDVLKQILQKTSNKKSIAQIADQKRKVMQTLSPYKGHESVKMKSVKEEDLANYLTVKGKEDQI